MAAPGSVHYGYYILSYQFVYVGNSYGKQINLNFNLLELRCKILCFSTQRFGDVCLIFIGWSCCCIRYQYYAYHRSTEGTILSSIAQN